MATLHMHDDLVNQVYNTVKSKIYNDIKSKILNDIYPVGAVYISASSTSPQTLFGGTWTAITGRFLLAQDGSTYKAGNTRTDRLLIHIQLVILH